MSVRVDTDWSYRGIPAVVISNKWLRVVMLPELGGKIWQITDLRNGRDLLWQNPRLLAHRVPIGTGYDDVFFGGWDELFPNDEPEVLDGDPYPDHGELWTALWQVKVLDDGPDVARITLTTATPISCCHLSKTITVHRDEPQIHLSWRIHNAGLRELPYLWKQHVAVPATDGAVIGIGAGDMYVEDFGRPRAGGAGTRYVWPNLVDDNGTQHDMRRALPRSSAVAEFQYATALHAGWCAVSYPDGSGLGLAFDPDVFRSCWTFASYGGWRGHEVVILEPCTGHPVSVGAGIAAGTHQTLAPSATIETALTMVAFQGISEVTGIDPSGVVAGTALEVTSDAH
jgi:hypothetical protein